MNELAVSTITFRALDLATALEWIAAEGFTTVDLALIPRFCPHADPVGLDDEGRRRLRGLFDARGLRAMTMNTWSLTALNGPDGPEVELAWLPSARQVALLRRGALDLGFLRPPATHAGLDLAVLRHEGVVCAMTERHRLARAGTLAMQALQGERLVGFGPVIGTLFQRRIEAELRRRHVHTQPGPRAADTRAVCGATLSAMI